MQSFSEYDQALLYTYSCDWNQLMSLMVSTRDEMFSKRIEHFLHAFKYERDLDVINEKLQSLFQYIEHAQDQIEEHPSFF